MLAKVGLDGHDRGIKVVARILRDAGMEVIYTGLHRRPEEVVAAALQEDVDILGVSILSGAHLPIFSRISSIIREQPERYRFILLAGGVIPDEDLPALKVLGVAAVIGQDATPETVVSAVRSLVRTGGRVG